MKKQKEKLKSNNAITLIALIITIIVLLILAVVSIKLIWSEGIIEHANNAVTKYSEAQTNELKQINSVTDYMIQYNPENNEKNRDELWKLIHSRIESTGDGLLTIVGISASQSSASGYLVVAEELGDNILLIYADSMNSYEMVMSDINSAEIGTGENYQDKMILGNKWYRNIDKGGSNFGEVEEISSIVKFDIPENEVTDQEVYELLLKNLN